MKVSTYILSLCVAVVVIISMVIFSGASLGLFVNLPALFVVVVFPLAMLRAGFAFSEMGRHIAAAFTNTNSAAAAKTAPQTDLHPEQHLGQRGKLNRAALFFSAMRNYLLFSGFIGGMVGTITILANPDNSVRVGFGAALVLLTILYALVLWALVALPMRTAVRKRLALLEPGSAESE